MDPIRRTHFCRPRLPRSVNLAEPGANDSVVYQIGLTDTVYTVTSLPPGTATYDWRVRAENAIGQSDWATWWSFTTAPTTEAPLLTTPSDNATDVSLTPQFVWETAQGGHTYQVDLARSSSFDPADLIHQEWLTGTSFTMPTGVLLNDSTYFWRAKVQGPYPWSETWRFTTKPALPDVPVLGAPDDGTADVGPPVTLAWNIAPGAESYDLQVDEDPGFGSPEVNVTAVADTSHEATGLLPGLTYFWRVRSVNDGGVSAWALPWRISTLPLPAVPTLTMPQDEAIDVITTPTLEWLPATDADTYELQLDNDGGFSQPEIDETDLTGLSYPSPLLAENTTYYWRMRSVNAAGASDWTPTASFTTEQGPFLRLTYPNGGESLVLGDLETITWESFETQGQVKIELMHGTNEKVIATSSDDGSEPWTVSYESLVNFPGPRTDFLLRIYDSVDPTIGDTSFYFSISTDEDFRITYPNGGEILSVTNHPLDVFWENNSGLWGSARLELYKGTQYMASKDVNAPLGPDSDSWSTLPALPEGDDYRVGIILPGQNFSERGDFSDEPFTITSSATPTISVIQPSGGQECRLEDTCQINWTHSQQQPVTLDLYEGTATWKTTLIAFPNYQTGYNWFIPPTIEEGTNYRIRASDNQDPDNIFAFSGVFEITGAPPPNQVTLEAPNDGQDPIDPINAALEWQAVPTPPSATHYDIELWQSDCTGMPTNLVTDTVPVTQTTRPLSALGVDYARTYYWRVRAINGPDNKGPWSDTWMFRTSPDPLGWHLVTPPSPLDGATDVSLTPTLAWQPHPDACSYVVKIRRADGGWNANRTVSGPSSTLYDVENGLLADATEYFWDVVASRDLSGTAQFTQTSDTWYFTTEEGAPPPEPTPLFWVSTSSLAYGSVETGTTKTRTIQVRNTGQGTLSGTFSISGAGFSFGAGSTTFNLGAQDEHEIEIVFAPQAAQPYTGTLTIAHNAPGSPAQVALHGTGVDPPPPGEPLFSIDRTEIDFGNVVEATPSTPQTLTISNIGEGTLTGTFSISPSGAFSFTSGGTGPENFSLTTGEQRQINVVFTPPAVGPFSASVSFYDELGALIETVTLDGQGTSSVTASGRYYYLRDHLGSVRATANEAGTLVHMEDYYPFGMSMPGRNNVAGEEGDPAGKPRFTGHEQEVDIDPDFKAVYYAGARYYDGLLGKWNAVDPLGQYASPYTYVGNDPMGGVDPSGLMGVDANEAKGVDASQANRLDCSTSRCATTYSFSGFVGSGFVDDPDPEYVGALGEVVVEAERPSLGSRIFSGLFGSPFDAIQTGLDFLGMIPIIGAIPDLANSVISLGRAGFAALNGDGTGAALFLVDAGASAFAAIPGVGDVAGGAKITTKIALASSGAIGVAARQARRVAKIKNGPKFPNLKDHARRHSDLHPNAYYNEAVRHMNTGHSFKVRHNGQNKIVYVTRLGPDSFLFTSTSRNGKVVLTHLDVNTKYLGNKGITLPRGF